MLSAAAVCGVEFRVNTIAAALERDAAWVGQTCDELAREQLWLVAPRAEEGSDAAESPYSFRHALFRQVLYERTTPSVRSQLHRKIGAALERERARRRAGHRGGARHALRAWPRADGRVALLRRSRRSRACALQPGRVHEHHRTCVDPARAGAGGYRAQRTGDHDRNASRRVGHPRAWRGSRSEERVPASVLAARRRLRSIRCADGCCTGSGSCFVCARTMPRRSRWRNEPRRSRRRRTIRCLCSPRAPCMERWISFRVDRARPGTWLERGLAARRAAGRGSGRNLRGRSAGHAARVARHPPSSSGPRRAGARAAAAGARPRSPAGMADGAARRQSGTARCSRCDSATRSVSPLLPTRCARSSTNSRSLTVELRAGGFAAGRTPEWAQPRDGYRRIREAYEDNTRLGMLAGGSEILGYATEALLLAGDWDGSATRNSTKRCKSRTRSASACICRSCS